MWFKLFIFGALLAAMARTGEGKGGRPAVTGASSGRLLPPPTQKEVADLPAHFDWRNVNNQNFASKVLSQQLPSVCGSCWAEASTGALSDRFAIATHNALRIQLAVQVLLNFDGSVSGGSCLGGDAFKAYEFMHTYGITDDTCAPFAGVNYGWGFEHAIPKSVEDARAHMCRACDWESRCVWLDQKDYRVYGVDDFGKVQGVSAMMAEIYKRGPIACYINSEPSSFDLYDGGIIDDPHPYTTVDHVIVIAGWGEDAQGRPYWIGRNSYGTRWGEGAGGGWFRILRGNNTLNMEDNEYGCDWAVPAKEDVLRELEAARMAS